MRYEVRAIRPNDPSPYRADRWVIHDVGLPNSIAGYALTKRGAFRTVRRWTRQYERASRSYAA